MHRRVFRFIFKQDTRGAVVQIADFLGYVLSDDVIDKIVGLVTVESMKTRYNVAGDLAAPGTGREGRVGAPNLMRKGWYKMQYLCTLT